MRFTLKLMANLTDPRDGDVSDRVINALSRSPRPPERAPPRTARPARQDDGRD